MYQSKSHCSSSLYKYFVLSDETHHCRESAEGTAVGWAHVPGGPQCDGVRSAAPHPDWWRSSSQKVHDPVAEEGVHLVHVNHYNLCHSFLNLSCPLKRLVCFLFYTRERDLRNVPVGVYIMAISRLITVHLGSLIIFPQSAASSKKKWWMTSMCVPHVLHVKACGTRLTPCIYSLTLTHSHCFVIPFPTPCQTFEKQRLVI